MDNYAILEEKKAVYWIYGKIDQLLQFIYNYDDIEHVLTKIKEIKNAY